MTDNLRNRIRHAYWRGIEPARIAKILGPFVTISIVEAALFTRIPERRDDAA